MTTARIGPELITFLKQLKKNNNREWFQKNKDSYEHDVRGPLLKFIEVFGPRLKKISPHFVADPRKTGGSLFRIYRDTRFSRDKRPYKTHAGVQFRHERASEVHAPGFYLHIEPEQAFVGVGIWDGIGALRSRRSLRSILAGRGSAQKLAPRRPWQSVAASASQLRCPTLMTHTQPLVH